MHTMLSLYVRGTKVQVGRVIMLLKFKIKLLFITRTTKWLLESDASYVTLIDNNPEQLYKLILRCDGRSFSVSQ